MKSTHKAALIILDGWGIGPADKNINAVMAADTPFLSSLADKYPHATLLTSGEDVGLPAGQMGNSEVGHLNIGAGRVVYQQLALINKAFSEQTVAGNPALIALFNYVKEKGCKLHLLGLVSEGGVHSSLDHLKGLCTLAGKAGLQDVFIHAFTDGRDTDPKSGLGFVRDLEIHTQTTPARIASVIGRYYAMDRDKRWERVKLAYDLLVHGKGKRYNSALDAIQASYNAGETDEFIKPAVITGRDGQPLATIQDGDAVLFFNFRTDRGRQLTQALSQQAFPEFDMKPLDLYFVTMTEYDATYKGVHILFPTQDLNQTLGEVVAQEGLTQVRMAETEKYPHVTFFFSGQREEPFQGESRILIPSPKVATYDLQPEMSANELADAAVLEIEKNQPDLIVLNFANPDMVGHTGVFKAVVKAMETVDRCANKVVTAALDHGYEILLLADHGNADYMVNPDGSPNTAHTTNPVPVYYITPDGSGVIHKGRLADVAPTILKMLGLRQPDAMTGRALI